MPVDPDDRMAGPQGNRRRAHDILIDYIRQPWSDLVPTALHYLALIDADVARREALALLEGPRRDLSTTRRWRHCAATPNPKTREIPGRGGTCGPPPSV